MKKIALLGVILAGQVCAMKDTGEGRFGNNSMVPYQGSYNSVPVNTNAVVAVERKYQADIERFAMAAKEYKEQRNFANEKLEYFQREYEELKGLHQAETMSQKEEIETLKFTIVKLQYALDQQEETYKLRMNMLINGELKDAHDRSAEKFATLLEKNNLLERRLAESEKQKEELEYALADKKPSYEHLNLSLLQEQK